MSPTQNLSSQLKRAGTPNRKIISSQSSTAGNNSKPISNSKSTPSNIANNNNVLNNTSSKNNAKTGKVDFQNLQKTNRKRKWSKISNSSSSPAAGLSSHTTGAAPTKYSTQKSLTENTFFSRTSATASNSSIKSYHSGGLPDGNKRLGKNSIKTIKSGSAYISNDKSSTVFTVPGPSSPSKSLKAFPIPTSYVRYPNSILAKSLASLEKSRSFRSLVERAIKEHRIFSCCGGYPTIRKALKRRGWVEKPQTLIYTRSLNSVYPSARSNDESDVLWLTRVLRAYHPDFVWVIRRDNVDWKLQKEQLVNRFPRAWFTTKVGLTDCLQHMHWFSEAGISDSFFPRCYRLCLEEERQAFQDDFRLTACISYLRYFIQKFELKGKKGVSDRKSHISQFSLDFACRQLGNHIKIKRNEDIDWLLPPNNMVSHWEAFLNHYYAVVHDKKKIRFDNSDAVRTRYEHCNKMLETVANYWPQAQLDGIYNMWICKPGARSRGLGIKIMNNLDRILSLMSQSNFREVNWVIQKYIEKPMLVYKTKFDIRQWFLVVNWAPLTVWFYKESYIRFCSKPFDLENYHESIHLCNNAVQCRYQNSVKRDSNLPKENMWSSDSFQAYLKSIEKGDMWPQIYSKMKQAIVGVMLASQENVQYKKGSFELYGADFMLTEDFQPWLIEINSCPCMASSTKVTAKLCSQCLEDTIKVVVDRRHNRTADTGKFEMIYKQNANTPPGKQFNGQDLTIIGQKLNRNIDWPAFKSNQVSRVPSTHRKSLTSLSRVSSQTRSALVVNNNKSKSKISLLPNQILPELIQKIRLGTQGQPSSISKGNTSLSKKKSEAKTNSESKTKIQKKQEQPNSNETAGVE